MLSILFTCIVLTSQEFKTKGGLFLWTTKNLFNQLLIFVVRIQTLLRATKIDKKYLMIYIDIWNIKVNTTVASLFVFYNTNMLT